jgi:hypothetical protein
MLVCKFSRSVLGIALCAALLVLSESAPRVSAADGPVAQTVKKVRPRGRLPKHYADVVTEKQREDIYKIQEEYKPKLEALQAQLDAMNKEMNEKIKTVLTPEQKKKVEDAEAGDKTKSAKTDKTADKPADKSADKPADKPADKTEKKVEK